MNFEFSSCLFSNNIIFNQNNPNFSSQKRTPFTDLTRQIHSFENSKKNQQNILFSKNFNDNSFYNEDYMFLKKKSYCENSNNYEKYVECKMQTDEINKNKKNFNNCDKNHNSLINNLDEDDDEQEKENLGENNFKKNTKNKDLCLSFNQILNEAINEKKEFDKNERDKKKANKLRKIKILLKNRKNANDYTNKNTYISNKENINLNNISQKNYCIGILEQKREKELNLMNLD